MNSPTQHPKMLCFLAVVMLVQSCWQSQGFVHFTPCGKPAPVIHSQTRKVVDHAIMSPTALNANNLFGGSFGLPGKGKVPTTTTTTVLDLPCRNLKVGPLKFFLQVILVGAQNTPSQGAWIMKANDETKTLDMYFTDGTAMCSVDLQETGMKVLRNGRTPSLQYRLQESVLLHSLLDEVEGIAFAEDIDVDKRLLQFVDDGVLQEARSVLPARAENKSDD